MNKDIKLTVLMPSFNKGLYISEAIDSVLMQKSSFRFELLIIDDKSTDQSLEIAYNYQARHPDKITVLANDTNLGCVRTTIKGYEYIKTDYFCVLDPDDYWIDKHKLQRAVDFLDLHPDFTMYISNTYFEKSGKRTPYVTLTGTKDFDFAYGVNAISGHTSGVIFRNSVFKYGVPKKLYDRLGSKYERSFEGDTFRNILHLYEGKARFSNIYESVYRVTGEGIWTSHNQFQQNNLNAAMFYEMFLYFDKVEPAFLLQNSIWFCIANLKLLTGTKKMEFLAGDLENFWDIFSKVIKYKSEYMPLEQELLPYIVFYCPSQTSGKCEKLFENLAVFFAETMNLEVHYVDLPNGFVRRRLSDSNIKFIDYSKKRLLETFQHPVILIAPFDLSHELPVLKHESSKLLLCFSNPKNLDQLRENYNLADSKMHHILINTKGSKAAFFTDFTSLDQTNNKSKVQFDEIYVPLCTEKISNIVSESLISEEEINIGWLGGLDSEQIFSLINLLNHFLDLNISKKKTIHIIGAPQIEKLIEVGTYSSQINLIFTPILANQNLNEYLSSHIDILFATGIACLEGAKLTIPSVINCVQDEEIASDEFLWLFDAKKYTLEYRTEHKTKMGVESTSLTRIIEEIYDKGNKVELGRKCYDYFLANHSIDHTAACLLSTVIKVYPTRSVALKINIFLRVFRDIKRNIVRIYNLSLRIKRKIERYI
jgi:glycosyltransferase involved in cell wall biosynthesis